MANITPRTNKDGTTVFRIRVYAGRDSEGKQRIFQTTWKADPKRTESANKKALNKFAADYEMKCLSGEIVEQRVIFGTYCRKLVDDKQRNGLIKLSTANFYRSLYPLLHDIDGVPLPLVNANTLNNLYRNLLDKPSISDTKYRLKAKTDLLKLGEVSNKTQFSQKIQHSCYDLECRNKRQDFFTANGGENFGSVTSARFCPVQCLRMWQKDNKCFPAPQGSQSCQYGFVRSFEGRSYYFQSCGTGAAA